MYYLVIIKSDSQAIYSYESEDTARSAYHTELASAYSSYEQETISNFTIMVLNQSGDTVAKEFKFKQVN